MKVQVLVATMHASDFSKIESMRISSDVFFANQADGYSYMKKEFNGHVAEMLTTQTRGLSRNRNLALTNSGLHAEYLMFADDDMIFTEDYEDIILGEFEKHPEAEAIKFRIENIDHVRKSDASPIKKFKRATVKNITAFGVCGLAIRRDTLLKRNLHFNESFGTGTENYCGEDTIFLQEIVKKKIPFYLSPIKIADVNQEESTWFEGYNEKYFEVAGMVLASVFPRLSWLLAIRSAYHFAKRKRCTLKFGKILKSYYSGIRKQITK